MTPKNIFRFSDIKFLIRDILIFHETPPDIAEIVSESLVQAEGKGVLSHGILRLQSYIQLIEEGVLDNKARPVVKSLGISALSVDGKFGFGMLLGREAAIATSDASSRTGICVTTGRNFNHLGMLEYFTEPAAQNGYITIAMTNAHPTVTFPGGKEAAIGTNPICVSIPSIGGPFNLDMAISKSSFGKIREAALEGEKIPEDIALDNEGNGTTDPIAALSGSLLPFGGIKGYALGMIVDMLAGILSGSAAGHDVITWNIERKRWNSGMTLIAIDPRFYLSLDQFKFLIEQYLEKTRNYSPEHRAPGDRRRQKLLESQNTGLRIKSQSLNLLRILAKNANLVFPSSISDESF